MLQGDSKNSDWSSPRLLQSVFRSDDLALSSNPPTVQSSNLQLAVSDSRMSEYLEDLNSTILNSIRNNLSMYTRPRQRHESRILPCVRKQEKARDKINPANIILLLKLIQVMVR